MWAGIIQSLKGPYRTKGKEGWTPSLVNGDVHLLLHLDIKVPGFGDLDFGIYSSGSLVLRPLDFELFYWLPWFSSL